MLNNALSKAYVAVAPGAVYDYPATRNDYVVTIMKQAFLKDKEKRKNGEEMAKRRYQSYVRMTKMDWSE